MLSDLAWVLVALRARRHRRRLDFARRVRFDQEIRPRLASGAIVAYPDAFYCIETKDIRRAVAAVSE